jgi:hypothetical protein
LFKTTAISRLIINDAVIKANVSMLSNYKAVATDKIDAPKYVIKESNNAACTCYNQHKYN